MNFKEALIAHLQGEKVEVFTQFHSYYKLQDGQHKWRSFGDFYSSFELGDADCYSKRSGDEYRLAPRTIFVNGVEVPAPESVAPAVGDVVWIADPCGKVYMCYPETWSDHAEQIELLSRKLVHKTKEDAIARSKAMLLTSDNQKERTVAGGVGKIAEKQCDSLQSGVERWVS